MRRLFILLVFCSAHAVITTGNFDFQLHFSVDGGSGDINVLEYPGDFSGQIGRCDSMDIHFPPYESDVSCKVHTFKGGDYGYAQYTTSSLTEATESMSGLAHSLTRDEEDKFEKAIALASWIRQNIEYDLGVGETQETAAWVYSNKVGTCDELSHIFISLARAAGLGARYVSGYAWDGDEWLAHAWAEVWTRYGWTPIDIAFDEYGYVDGRHISVYKGADGDHNFILISYFGDSQVEHSFDIVTLNTIEELFIMSAKVADSMGGAYSLLEMSAFNPFPTPIAFFPKLISPKGFDTEIMWPESVVLSPGENKVYIVLKIPEVESGYVYNVPVNTYLGTENYSVNFTVSGNYDCPEIEETTPYTYDVTGCTDLVTKQEASGTAASGRFFCGMCYYVIEEPQARSYQLDYPEFCLGNCTLTVNIIGSGSYLVSLDDAVQEGVVDVYVSLEFPIGVGNHTLTLDGVGRPIEILEPPEAQVNQSIDGNYACFLSNWALGTECFNMVCGENEFELNLRYGDANITINKQINRECSFFQKILDFLLGIIMS